MYGGVGSRSREDDITVVSTVDFSHEFAGYGLINDVAPFYRLGNMTLRVVLEIGKVGGIVEEADIVSARVAVSVLEQKAFFAVRYASKL